MMCSLALEKMTEIVAFRLQMSFKTGYMEFERHGDLSGMEAILEKHY